jgi:hypothetical protein
MSKIEPMSVEEIKEHLGLTLSLIPRGEGAEAIITARLRLILAWAHERALKNQSYWQTTLKNAGTTYKRMSWDQSDWLNEVLDEIGWPKEQR